MKHKACYIALAICLLGLVNCTSGDHNPFTGSAAPLGEVISATSGTPQSHEIGGRFATPLVATVMKNGLPASDVVVTFAAPAIGATGTFADTGADSTKATTDANGSATSAVFRANGIAGSYTVTASIPGTSQAATFNLTNAVGAPAAIIAVSGTPQASGINASFPAPFMVKVLDSGQNSVINAMVTFQAPAAGASGIFADSGTSTTTATTNESGLATSAAFTANGMSGSDTVSATVGGVTTPASFNLTNLAGAPATIVATSGTLQQAAIGTAFAAPLVATVLDSLSNPVSGVAVTFSAPISHASGTFANGMTSETDTTDASGIATSTVFSANGTTGGPYEVTATVGGAPVPADFSLTNTLAFKTYVFYLSGQEVSTAFYALAGSVQIDSSGNVLGGEQDYNDGVYGLTSPQPSGDAIIGGSLTVSATTGQGTLTLITNNSSLGAEGTEILGVQFVNLNHALIAQFDGTATSSGSMDLQTLPATLSGGYAFSLAGVDPNTSPVAFGGVFTISGGTTLQNGFLDTNDGGAVATNAPLSGTLSAFDSFGRGTISSTINYTDLVGTPAPVSLNYYVVGPGALRIIDVDSANNGGITSDSAVGSAFGQGSNAISANNAQLGESVFAINGSPYPANFAAVGMFSTSNISASTADLSGVADDNEVIGIQMAAAPIGGTYSIASNGYGSLTIGAGDLGDVSALGIYLTDPNLNISDPNNSASGLGGALVADMDSVLAGGTGVIIPQTDTSTASFNGRYAFGAQAFFDGFFEFDFVGIGSVTSGTLSGIGLVSDPLQYLGGNVTDSGVKFGGAPQPDTSNPGRYTLFSTNATPNPLKVKVNTTITPFDVVLYQASGGQLFWLDEDAIDVFLGSLQQQGSLTGLPAAQKPAARNGTRAQR